jgi:hypothetical protein
LMILTDWPRAKRQALPRRAGMVRSWVILPA